MKKLILLFLILLIITFFGLSKSAPPSSCVDPTDDLYINSNTTLCSGFYNINDAGYTGVIIINASNIVLDCNGTSLKGNDNGVGIYNLGHDEVEIKNCNISHYGDGISITSGADTNNLNDNNASENVNNGIIIQMSNFNVLRRNRATLNYYGISIQDSYNIVLSENIACANSELDITHIASTGAGTENKCDNTDEWRDIGYTTCTYICDCHDCADCAAKLNSGRSVMLGNDIYEPDGSCINITNVIGPILFDCQNHVITGKLLEFGYGIRITNSESITVQNCTITNFTSGITVDNSLHNKFYTNTLNYNYDYGSYLQDSTNNLYEGNQFLNNKYGLYLRADSGNTLRNNRICKNEVMDIMRVNASGPNTRQDNICNKIYNWNNLEDFTWCDETCTGNISTNCSTWEECADALTGDYGHVDLTDDIYGGIDVGSSHITVDCDGHRIIGVGTGSGVEIINEVNNKIINCEILNFTTGITLQSSAYCDLINNSVHDNSGGVYLSKSFSSGLLIPIKLNEIIENNITDNEFYGLKLDDAEQNNVTYNKMLRNGDYSLYISDNCDNTIANNLGGDGFPIKFVHHTVGNTAPGRYSEIIYCEATGGTVMRAFISNDPTRKEDGILLIDSNNVWIERADIRNSNGIQLYSSNSNTIFNSTISNSSASGIYLQHSHSNEIEHNLIRNHTNGNGITNEHSNQTRILNNDILWNTIGIFLDQSSNADIGNNTVHDNSWGVHLSLSTSNNLTYNEVMDNEHIGIYLDLNSNLNQLYNNKVCRNRGSSDISNAGTSSTGDDNRCSIAHSWDDIGTTGCTLNCVGWYPYRWGFGYHNPSRDLLTYGWPPEFDGHFVDVFGTDQTYESIWICIGLPLCSPWGCWCGGYEIEVPVIPDRHAVIYYGFFMNLADDGECFGMSGKSLDFYYGDDVVSNYNLSAVMPRQLLHTGELKRNIENMHGYQTIERFLEFALVHYGDEPNDVLNDVKAALASGDRGILIVRRSLLNGHAMVIDTVDEIGDESRIYVYDMNREFTTCDCKNEPLCGRITNDTGHIIIDWCNHRLYRNEGNYPYVRINRTTNEWEFRMAGGGIWRNAIWYTPHSIIKSRRRIPAVFEAIASILVGDATGMVTDENGNRLGIDEYGNEYEEIPNATGIPILADAPENRMLLAMPSGNYNLDVFGNETGNYSNYFFTQNIMYGIENVSSDLGTIDHVKLLFKDNNPMDGLISFLTEDTTKTFSSEIVKEFRNNDAKRIYRVINSNLYGGDEVMIRTTPDFDGLVFTNRGSHTLTYGAELATSMMEPGDEGSTDYQRLRLSGVTIQPMVTRLIRPASWYNLSQQTVYLYSYVCGDNTCSEPAEDYLNCPEDCLEPTCVEPYDDMLIESDTLLCYGNYSIIDGGNPGVIIINNDNVELDCNGATLVGNGGIGINLNGFDYGKVHNCKLMNYEEGISLIEDSNSNEIYHNYIRYTGEGIKVAFSLGNKVRENIVDYSLVGVLFQNSDNSELKNNYLCYNALDINLVGSTGTSGFGNICEFPDGWNDNGTTGCTYPCTYQDSDKDGIPDIVDNCWHVNNTDQNDTDEDCPKPPYAADPKCGDACEAVLTITIVSPNNCTDYSNCTKTDAYYYKEFVYLNFTNSTPTDWISYNVNGTNMTITGNTTIDRSEPVDCALNNMTLFASKGSDEVFEKISFFYALGDLNLDGKVDIKDIATTAISFGATCDESSCLLGYSCWEDYSNCTTAQKWNPDADMNYDYKVDIKDIAMVAKQFGKVC